MSIAEVGSDVDFGKKRRLPVWMSGVGSSPVKSRISEDEDSNGRSGPPSHALTFEATNSREDATVSEKVLVVENDKRKRTRRLYRKRTTDVSSSVDLKKRGSKNNGMDETKSKMNDGTLRSKNLRFKLHETNEEANDNEVQLTVEDLISIAREYVSADDARDGWDASTRESKSEGMASTSSFPAKSNSKESYSDIGTRMSISSKCTKAPSSSDQAEINGHVNDGPEGIIPSNIPWTGDAAQDMMDVFLGPLLQKVDVREGKNDIPTMGDLISSSELNKPARNEAGQNVEVHLEKKKKKKSSLKDKVAMFLD